MSDFTDILSREILHLQEDVADTMDANQQVATGKTIKALRSESGDEFARLLDPAHSCFLRDGRGPGPVNIQAIIEWVRAKRLRLDPYAVAERISQLGTLRYRGEDPRFTKPTGTFSGPIAAALPRFRAGLVETARTGLRSELVHFTTSRL